MSILRKTIILIFIILLVYSCEKEVSVSEPIQPVPIRTAIITSMPAGAKIYENGRNSGRITPDTLGWMEVGEYQFILKLENYRDTSFSIDLTENEKVEIDIDYHKNPKMLGSILCKPENEDVEIYLDGEFTNELTPTTLQNVIPGIHTITYKKENFREKTVELLVKSNFTVEERSELIDTSKWVDYSTETSAISSDYLTCLEIDDKGGIWIGSSDNGLIYFDGKEFINYNSDNSIFESDFINNIEIDSDGTIWICTFNGLYSFNGINWQVFNSRNYFPTDVINDIKIDRDGNYWVATQRGLLYTEKGNLNEWKIFFEIIYSQNPGDPLPDIEGANMKTISLDEDKGQIWAGLGNGDIYIYSREEWRKFQAPLGIGTNYVANIITYDDGIYLGRVTKPGKDRRFGGFYRFRQTSRLFPTSGLWYAYNYLLRAVDVYDINKVDETLWISTHKGLVEMVNNSPKLYNVANTELRTNGISGSREDKHGNLWVITIGRGLYKYKKNQ